MPLFGSRFCVWEIVLVWKKLRFIGNASTIPWSFIRAFFGSLNFTVNTEMSVEKMSDDEMGWEGRECLSVCRYVWIF